MNDRQLTEVLNRNCHCVTTDAGYLSAQIAEAGETGPIFATSPLFISRHELEQMKAVIETIDGIVRRPDYPQQAGFTFPPIADVDQGPLGVFFSFDFHLSDEGPRLIEINTNAGGALLNLALSRAQRACCDEIEPWMTSVSANENAEAEIVSMFQNEWILAGRKHPLATIAIVDDGPREQFLYPEFVLFQKLFERAGLDARILDPQELHWDGATLLHEGTSIDLVYNRLTDFYFAEERHAAIRAAYEAGAVVVTPHPRAYARYADKRNLTVLGDPVSLRRLGVTDDSQALLRDAIPSTAPVTTETAAQLWTDRKQYFFKPVMGYGSKAAYRGDKITKGVWERVVGGDYVAQRFVRPSERVLPVAGEDRAFKVDVRCYVYDGKIQTVAARLYRGQTTNLRSEGGGFAAVYVA